MQFVYLENVDFWWIFKCLQELKTKNKNYVILFYFIFCTHVLHGGGAQKWHVCPGLCVMLIGPCRFVVINYPPCACTHVSNMTLGTWLREWNVCYHRPLTVAHRRVRLEWCSVRSTRNCADWECIVFSDESLARNSAAHDPVTLYMLCRMTACIQPEVNQHFIHFFLL